MLILWFGVFGLFSNDVALTVLPVAGVAGLAVLRVIMSSMLAGFFS